MLITIDGLVLSRRDFGETSCFADILTSEFGVIEVAAKGVKKLNNPLSSSLSILTLSTFCFNKRNLRYTINSSSCKHSFHALSADLESLSLAMYFSELIKYTTPPEQPSGDILKNLLISLTKLEHTVPTDEVKTEFELRLIHSLGIARHDLKPQKSEEYLINNLGRNFKTLEYYKNITQS